MDETLSEKKPEPAPYPAVAIADMIVQAAAKVKNNNPENGSIGMIGQTAQQFKALKDSKPMPSADTNI